MTYEIIGEPRIEEEYSDRFETVMVIDLKREDGETGDVWIVAGVPAYLQGESDTCRTQRGYERVRVFGDSVDMWCPNSFQVPNEDGNYSDVASDVIEACQSVAIKAHRQSIIEREFEQDSTA